MKKCNSYNPLAIYVRVVPKPLTFHALQSGMRKKNKAVKLTEDKRPHVSLDFEHMETPENAFRR